MSEIAATGHDERPMGGGGTVNLRSLEALRGVLAVYVLVGHARWLLWDGHFRWIQEAHPWWANALAYASAMFRYGHEAVMCFFVLSGFFIHFRWARSPDRSFDVADYARRRAHRLVPPYLLALAATLALDLVGWTLFPILYQASTGDALLDENFSRMGLSPQSVAPALLMLPGSLGTHFGSNGPLWSLAYEFVYYAMYPAWLYLRIRMGWNAYLLGSAVAIGLALISPLPFLGSTLLLYPLWLAGAAMAEYFLAAKAGTPPLLLSASLAAAGFGLFHFSKTPYTVVPYLMLGIGIVTFAASLPQRAVDTRLHCALEALGVRSYTLYICHFPFLALMSAAVFETWGRRPSSGWLASCGVIATLGWCQLLWWLVERRFLHARFELQRAKAGP